MSNSDTANGNTPLPIELYNGNFYGSVLPDLDAFLASVSFSLAVAIWAQQFKVFKPVVATYPVFVV